MIIIIKKKKIEMMLKVKIKNGKTKDAIMQLMYHLGTLLQATTSYIQYVTLNILFIRHTKEITEFTL